MNKVILSLLFICSIGYPVFGKGNNIKFQNSGSGSKFNLKDGETCYTEDGKEGTCLAMRKCSEVNDLIKSRGGMNTKGTADLIRKRICNFAFKEARVCCIEEQIPNNPILPTHDECGLISATRITGGEDFLHGVHPWLVGVGYLQDRRSLIKVKCGGTLITRRHVLSASHCFVRTQENQNIPDFTHVILGEHSLSKNNERKSPIILKIVERRSPGYNISHHYVDIELLTLERDVEFSDYIVPACLPFKKYEKHFSLLTKNMTIAGWGRTSYTDPRATDTPKQAKVPLIPLDMCKKAYEETFQNVMIDETQICLGGNGRDTCPGDSGGPVIYRDRVSRRYFVIGITAFGTINCGDPNFPGVYTYVPAYMKWILNNL